MNRIEEAIRKAHRRRGTSPAVATPKKKVAFEGPKHHVDLTGLVQCGLLAPPDQMSTVSAEFRRIKRPLLKKVFAGADASDSANVIMLTSGLPGAGKTFCAVNLAVSISLERERNVLLVDADVSKPNISRAFGLADAPGLIDLLLDETRRANDVLVRTDLNDIQILPAGRSHPHATELLASDRMTDIVKELGSRYRDRLVVVDSPPLLVTNEAQALVSHAGQIALVVEAGVTTHQQLARMIETLDADDVVNIILNKTQHWGKVAGYGDDYAYWGYDRD